MRRMLLCLLSIGISINCLAFGKSEEQKLEADSQWMKKTLLEMNQEFSDLHFADQTSGTPVTSLPVKLQILDHYGIFGNVGTHSLTTLTQKYKTTLDEAQTNLKKLNDLKMSSFKNELLFGHISNKKRLEAEIQKNKKVLENLKKDFQEFKKRTRSSSIQFDAKLYREILNDPKTFLNGLPERLKPQKPGFLSRIWSKLTRRKDYNPFTTLATAPELLAEDLLFIDAAVRKDVASSSSEADLQRERLARADGLWWYLSVKNAMKKKSVVEEPRKKSTFRGLSRIDYRRIGRGLGQMGCAAGMAVVAVGVSGLVGSTGFKLKERLNNSMLALNTAIPFAMIGAKNIQRSIYSDDELDSSVNLNESLKTKLGDYALTQEGVQASPGKSSQLAQ